MQFSGALRYRFATALFLLYCPAIYADGHNLDGMIIYVLGAAVLVYGLPALLLFILSYIYSRRGNKSVRRIAVIIWCLLLVKYAFLAYTYNEYAAYKRAGILYYFLLMFSIGVLFLNAMLIFPKKIAEKRN